MPQQRKPAQKADKAPGEFDPQRLDRSAISLPLLERLAEASRPKRRRRTANLSQAAELRPEVQPFDVIIDPHLSFRGGRDSARERICETIDSLCAEERAKSLAEAVGGADGGARRRKTDGKLGVNKPKTELSRQYVFARLTEPMVRELARRDRGAGTASESAGTRAVYRIWPDFEVKAQIDQSIRTVKADAAGNAFGIGGAGIVWAVLDSGIDALHPHFQSFGNLDLSHDSMLEHKDLCGGVEAADEALIDRFGHGTHVAGIIAGQLDGKGRVKARTRRRDEKGEVTLDERSLDRISGMAPRCKLLSVKVLDDKGAGQASSVIVALEYIQKLNEYGRMLRVHGVNLSAGYKFEPEWFACGQSPLCVEVDRLVKSGVVVVVAAGNTGYGQARSTKGDWPAGLPLTINDPGNAELAITVGSTHREMPHVYGVSYFSSKGPTGDGRAKPDLVAPGEKIISCTSAWAAKYSSAVQPSEPALNKQLDAWREQIASHTPASAPDAEPEIGCYREDSGTSMATPHVSGVIAAFLSARREFIGRPERVKEIFTATATDLRRERSFQGAGLVDLMRAIQSV